MLVKVSILILSTLNLMTKYIFQADVVRSLAILAVIGIHLVIPITPRPDFFGGSVWWIAFLLNCLFRISVPLFVILSGYLVLGKNPTIKDNISRVVNRILIPLIAYYIIFNLVYAFMAYLRNEEYDYLGIFHNLSKNTHTSLYFLVILLFIQLLNPLWNLLTEFKNELVLKYICYFFLALSASSFIFYYLSLREGEVFSTFTYWMMWVGYYLYGYLVKLKTTWLSKKETMIYSLLFIIGFIITVGFGYMTLWLFHNGLSNLFYIGGQTYADGYLSFSVMLMSLSGFNLLMRGKFVSKLENFSWLRKSIIFLATLSFALYLNHLLVIDTLSKFFGINPDSPLMPNLSSYLIINTLLTFIITIPLVFIIQKIPLIRKIVGIK